MNGDQLIGGLNTHAIILMIVNKLPVKVCAAREWRDRLITIAISMGEIVANWSKL